MMKKVAGSITSVAIICFFCSVIFAADAPRSAVLVIPFDDKTWEFKDSEETLTKAAGEAVAASGAYRHVTPAGFADNWMKALTEKEKKSFGPDPAKQMKNLRQYRPLFVHEDLGTLNEYKDRWGVDFVIIGEVKKEGDVAAALNTEIISMNTGRLYAVSDEFRPGEAAELIKRQVGLLLAKGVETATVNADALIVPQRSVVAYDIRAVNGEYIRVVMDYSSNRPAPDLQNIDIVPHRPITDGILPLKVMSKEKKEITFQYFYRQGQFVNIKISTDRPKEASGKAASGAAEYEEALTVTSKGGYELRFTFKWKDGEAKGVRAEPVVNPYSDVR
jgi:hypothetical protein